MYDYHTHTFFSDDSDTPIREMIESAIFKRIKEIAITDHCDPDYPDPVYPFQVEMDKYHSALDEMSEKYSSKIKVVKGLEIGIQHGETLKKCSDAVNGYNYDFVIGSFHCALGQDLYTHYFENHTAESGIAESYEYAFNCLKQYKDYDVLGHINVIDRYAPFIPGYGKYMDIIEAILKLVIEDGKGLEINTSSFRYGMEESMNIFVKILSLFKSLGGEIITIGSDAHISRDIGYMYDWATETLKSLGIKYISTYENRKAKPVKI